MSDKSDALERAVTELIEARTALDTAPSPRASTRADRAFARLAALLAPRIRYFTRAYGLADVAEDAAQAAAIGVHRAAERYDPRRARFTTYVNWQIRAELQALRLRRHGDQRSAGRRAVGAPLSLDALIEAGADAWLADPAAETAAEASAADWLATRAADRLTDDWAARRQRALLRGAPAATAPGRLLERVAAERTLIRHQLKTTDAGTRLSESDRHIVRRALADMACRFGGAKLN
ncbi:MAG: RNA polymerase subunit sigma-70 [Sphingopyxis sp.]